MGKQTIKGKYPEQTFFEMSDILTTFAMMENAGLNKVDYGTGATYTPAEVHTLSYIADCPGCSNTDISKRFNKTLGATSQVLARLKKKDLILTKKNKVNHKTLEVYLTEKGKELDQAHRDYDTKIWEQMIAYIKERFSEEEINTTFAVMNHILYYQDYLDRIEAEKATEE